jgi:hypothetical protein
MIRSSQPETARSGGGDFTRTDTWILAFLLSCAVGYAVFGLVAPMESLVFRLSDDSFYYFKVAQNIVGGAGTTFDGINPTNGFHPLWMVVILPVFALVSADPLSALRVIHVVLAILGAGGLWMAYRMMSEYGSRLAAAAASGLFLSPFLLNPLLNGLESGLLLFFSFMTIWALSRFRLSSTKTGAGMDVLLGVLLAAVFLSRLDSAFMILGILVLIVWRWMSGVDQPRSGTALLRKFVVVGAISAVFVIPYFAWNLASFGHIMPISGALKSTFPEVSFNPRRLLGYHALFGLGQIVVTLFLLGLGLALRRKDSSEVLAGTPWGILVALWFGNALHFANAMLFMNWGAHWWHYASYLPLTLAVSASTGSQILGRVGNPVRLAVATGAALLVLSISALGLDAARRGHQHREWYEAALWASRSLPDDAAVGMTDCGLFGYFSDRRTVNLDGVINGYEYQRAIRDGRLAAYLQSCGVSHIAAHGTRYREGVARLWLPARLHRGTAANILATPRAEVYRSEEHENIHGIPVRFFIWEMGEVDVRENGEPL